MASFADDEWLEETSAAKPAKAAGTGKKNANKKGKGKKGKTGGGAGSAQDDPDEAVDTIELNDEEIYAQAAQEMPDANAIENMNRVLQR